MRQIALALLLALSFTPAFGQEEPPPDPPPTFSRVYLAIGDSLTRPGSSYAKYVTLLRRQQQYLPFTTIEAAAMSGYTTDDILREWDTLVAPKLPAHVVSVLFGINDHARDTSARRVPADQPQIRPRVPVDRYVANLREIIARLRAVPHGDPALNGGLPSIVLIAPPIVSKTSTTFCEPHCLSRLSIYVERMRRLAAEEGVGYLDLYNLSGRAVGWDQALWAAPYTETGPIAPSPWTVDGTHPSEAAWGYFLPAIREAILQDVR